MFAAALFILLALLHSVVCQFGATPDNDGHDGPGFKPDTLISVCISNLHKSSMAI